MATTFITTDQSGTSQSIAAGDTLFVTTGVTWTGGGIDGVENTKAVIDGNLYGTSVLLGSSIVASDVARLTVGEDASITRSGSAVFMRADGNDVANHGDIRSFGDSSTNDGLISNGYLTLQNTGSIIADNGRGIDINSFTPTASSFHRILNTGLISGSIGIEINDGNANITNEGIIRGRIDGIYADAESPVVLLNSGLLEGGTDAIDLFSGDGHEITNTATGIIRGDIKMGGAVSASFANAGHVIGDYFGATGNGEEFLNSGTFDGEIAFDAGAAQFQNTGIINGDVDQQGGALAGTNSGTIYGDYGFGSGAVGLSLINSSTGEIYGNVSASSSNTTASDSVINAGLITGLVDLWGGFGLVVNTGTIAGLVRSIIDTAANISVDNAGVIMQGIQVAGGDLTVTNSGSIFNGVANTGGASLDTVNIFNDGLIEGDLGLVGTGEITVRNGAAGTIELVNLDTTADVTFDNSGVVAGPVTIDGTVIKVKNFGDIQDITTVEGTSPVIVANHGNMATFIKEGSGFLQLRNTGTIDQTVQVNDGGALVTNAGTIQGSFIGAINHGSTVRNEGIITGIVGLKNVDDIYTGIGSGSAYEVDGSGGNDTLIGSAAEDRFFGGSDNDLLRGRAGDDVLDGESGDDTLMGGSGDDSLLGGDGKDELSGKEGADTLDGGLKGDIMHGGSGDDLLLGDAGNDTMHGGSGDDTMEGGANKDDMRGGMGDDLMYGDSSADMMKGGSGNDTISGGAASDTMSGGAGADVFLFESQGDTGDSAANRDYITDFETGTDVLDLVGMGALTFTDTGSPIGGGTSSVWVRVVSGNTLVRFDFDGDGNRDAQIELIGTTGVTESDLILA